MVSDEELAQAHRIAKLNTEIEKRFDEESISDSDRIKFYIAGFILESLRQGATLEEFNNIISRLPVIYEKRIKHWDSIAEEALNERQ